MLRIVSYNVFSDDYNYMNKSLQGLKEIHNNKI